MLLKKQVVFFLIICLMSFFVLAGKNADERQMLKPLNNDDYKYIAINEIKMWVSNNGDGSHDPSTDAGGFHWPGGKLAKKTAIFEDGLIWGYIAGTDTLVNGNTHRQGLQAGKIFSTGVADDSDNPRYRIYKIRKDWQNFPPGKERDDLERDYLEWPVSDGAPWLDVDDDGFYSPGSDTPKFSGDEMLWYVANDLDTIRSRWTYGSDPIGLEFQTTTFGYNRINDLADVVFKKYLIINKGSHTIRDLFFGYWSDDDLGDASDDFVGCDTMLNLGYTWNSDNQDGSGSGVYYGSAPPAVGHMLVQGPIVSGLSTDSAFFNGKLLSGFKNLDMTSFSPNFKNFSRLNHDPYQGSLEGSIEFYNLLRGKNNWGDPIINPYSGDSTIYPLSGNPADGSGWYEGAGWPGGPQAGDRRLLISSGPVTMAPGDSQEVIIAILIARGEDNLDSITKLKNKAHAIQIMHDQNFRTVPVMAKPLTTDVPTDKGLMLYWETNTESYDRIDPFLINQGVSDSTYTFEGYRVWQFRDMDGSEPKVLATYDLANDVIEIYGRRTVNGYPAEVAEIAGENKGVRRSISITENSYDQKALNNGNPYYFAVTAYAYSASSDPTYIESEPEIIEVIPGLEKIDQSSPYDSGDKIIAEHSSGDGDGSVELMIVDPQVLTGDEYRVTFGGTEINLSYSLINHITNDTLIDNCMDCKTDTVRGEIIDGFKLNIHNTGLDEIRPARKYSVKEVVELKGPGGSVLDKPHDVFEHFNSTDDWEILSYGHESEPLQNINIEDKYAIGYHNYEIRFNSTGSQYYTTGSKFSFFPWTMNDSLAIDRVPFEIWDMGRPGTDEDDQRMVIKTLDSYASIVEDSVRVDRNGRWSQLANGDWEPIFAYLPDSPYQEPLPLTSGSLPDHTVFKFGKVIIRGNLPAEGTVIGVDAWKPLSAEDVFSVTATAPDTKDYASAKANLDNISVFPNPFSGFGTLSGYIKQDFMRFTNLPTRCTVRIFSLAGVFVRQIEKNDDNPWLDWDLRNNAGRMVGSGVYIAHIEMPHIGEKVMKLAIIRENQR